MRNFLCLLAVILYSSPLFTEIDKIKPHNYTVIIDPGHGGADGGAEGLADMSEKYYNLDISLRLRDIFLLAGYEVVMTRCDDGDTDKEEGFNKKKDILAREKLADEYPDSIFLSIHINSSPASRDKGFQVFYGTENEDSKALAEALHQLMTEKNLATRMREVKKAPESVYLMQNIENPCVLLECGFISNEEDVALLSDKKYRQKLAMVFFAATEKFIDKERP